MALRCKLKAEKLESSASTTIPTLTNDTHEGLIAWEAKLNDKLKNIELQLDKENAKRVVERLRASITELDVSSVSLGARKTIQETGRRNESSFIEREANNLIALIAKVRDQRKATELVEATARLVNYDDQALAKGDLLTLKSKLNELLSQQDFYDIASTEIMRIAHIHSSEAEALRRDAEWVMSKEELDEIKRRVTELLEAETARQDEEFVTKALEEVLSDLGFDAGNAFEVTDFGKVAIVESTDYPGYALRLQVNPKNGMLYTRMVALEVHDAADDAKVEQENCGNIKSLRDRLAKLGVEAELTSERPSGERPVEVLDGSTITTQVNRRRRASAGKVMSNAR